MAAEFTERRIQSNGNTVNFNIDRSQPYVDVQKNGQTQRIYGSQQQLDEYQSKKPDGTSNLNGPAKTKISQGTALRKDGLIKVSELDRPSNFVDNMMSDSDFQKSIDALIEGFDNSRRKAQLGNSPSKFPNPLEQFASMVPLWTLAVLTPKQFNKPSEYRTDDLSFSSQTDIRSTGSGGPGQPEGTVTLSSSIILSSGGRSDKTRTKIFGTAAPEYFIDNFKMNAVVAPSPKTGNTNAVAFEFDILEPYSMGLLLQSMQAASLKAGYPDYLLAPFLLRLDFKGYDERGRIIKSLKPKNFVLKFKKVTFSVSEGGSKYSVTAYPYNHQGFADTVDMLWQDISIAPEPDKDATVYSLLGDPDNPKSLVRTLNDNEQSLVEQGKYKIKEQYEIQFPERTYDFIAVDNSTSSDEQGTSYNPYNYESGRTVGGGPSAGTTTEAGKNLIGDSGFDYTAQKGGNFAFRKEDDVINEETGRIERGKLTINPTERVFNFSQKMKLTDIITQTILSSRHSSKAVNGELPLTAEGYVNWFRIDVQVEFIGYDDSVGDYAKKYTYRVVPYLAHASVFGNATAKPPGQKELKKQIVKEYNYIYSGQNADVIDFDIKINNLFYTGINPTVEGNTQSDANKDSAGTIYDGTKDVTATEGTDKKAQVANLGKSRLKKDPDAFSVLKGGPGTQSVEQRVAENFHNALVKNASADLIKVELQILGDTFWLVESGLSNYFVQAEKGSQYMADGTCNYEGNDVFIRINFRTPVDVNGSGVSGQDEPNGLYSFSKATTLSPFSGIYRVFKLESEFASGLFTQTLHCVRMQGQEEDFDGEAVKEEAGSNALATKIGTEKPPKTNVSQKLPLADKLANVFGFNSIEELQKKFPAGPKDKPKQPEGPTLTERRRQSNGTLVNFNIDRTKPFVDETDKDGNILRVYES